MLVSNDWKDYRLIDAGNGEKLESWGNVILRRPDPWALWTHEDTQEWNKYSAIYHRSEKGGGYWEKKKEIPEFWTINYKDLKFKVSPTGFKHTGLFPEQAANWDFIIDKIKNAAINSNIGFSLRKFKQSSIIIAPNPYIGQNGPFKKPLFTHLGIFLFLQSMTNQLSLSQ